MEQNKNIKKRRQEFSINIRKWKNRQFFKISRESQAKCVIEKKRQIISNKSNKIGK